MTGSGDLQGLARAKLLRDAGSVDLGGAEQQSDHGGVVRRKDIYAEVAGSKHGNGGVGSIDLGGGVGVQPEGAEVHAALRQAKLREPVRERGDGEVRLLAEPHGDLTEL